MMHEAGEAEENFDDDDDDDVAICKFVVDF